LQQADKLRGSPGVLSVEKSRIVTIQTSNRPETSSGPVGLSAPPGPPGPPTSPDSGAQPPTPAFLGLTGHNGVWQKQFGGDRNAGAGVIVGDIDTGFWPENPSFAAFKGNGPQVGDDQEEVSRHVCHDGRRSRHLQQQGDWRPLLQLVRRRHGEPGRVQLAARLRGHGSHTASTAAGDPVEALHAR
jgi:hypothetical protein